ncbi:MAG: SDR family oxidoreductase [Hyphomicrobiaceae bacterium]|nr:SDR family oxidoreductase [Hyphomicrobiaceae bacterium]
MAETRVALISGANRGIGLEIARGLARLGLMPAMGSRDMAKGEAAADTLRAEGLDPIVVALDVTDPASIAQAVATTIELLGRIDVLVNNAGILLERSSTDTAGSVLTATPSSVRETFEVNTIGPLLAMQAVLPHMQAQGYGRIVNMSSGMGQLSEMGGGHTAYRLSKVALNALTRTAAADVGVGPIKINAMCPGWVKTDMGGPDAVRSIAEGAETALWLATLPDDGPTGGFFRDKKPIPW